MLKPNVVKLSYFDTKNGKAAMTLLLARHLSSSVTVRISTNIRHQLDRYLFFLSSSPWTAFCWCLVNILAMAGQQTPIASQNFFLTELTLSSILLRIMVFVRMRFPPANVLNHCKGDYGNHSRKRIR